MSRTYRPSGGGKKSAKKGSKSMSIQGERFLNYPGRNNPSRRYRTFKNKNGSRTLFIGTSSMEMKRKKDANKRAEALRKNYNLLVRTIKTKNGWMNFVSPTRMRIYNRTMIPFQNFQDPTFGMDTPRLVNWLSQQPEYVAELSWQENLRRIGGDEALNTLAQLQNPEGFMGRMKKQVDAEKAIATGWNQMLIDQGFAKEGELSTETATQMKESDTVFDILGITDEKPDNQLNNDMFNQWFDEGLDQFPTSSQERKNKTRALEDILEDKIASEPITQSTPLSRELSDQFSNIFNEAIWGDDDTITRPDGTVVMKPMLEQDMSPTLGFSQPSIEFITQSGGSRGMWTFQPVEAGAWGDPEMELETRRAWLVSDSLGTVIQAYPYQEGEGARAEADAYEAIRQAYLFATEASASEPYTRKGYQKHGSLSPGVAVIDGKVTINQYGKWLGWDVNHTTDDGRLQSGDYTLFIDQEVLDQDDPQTTAAMTRNWILPKWLPSSGGMPPKDPMRDRLEAIIGQEGITSAEVQAAQVRAKVATEQGASAQEILDAMNLNRYIVKQRSGQPVTKFTPDYKSAMRTMQGFTAQDVGAQQLYVYQAPSSANGSIKEEATKLYAELQWSPERREWLVSYAGQEL